MFYLPFTLVNKNLYDEQQVLIEFPHAIYEAGGILDYWDLPIEWTVGPGQTVHELYLIDLLIYEDDPPPLFLINYADNDALNVYQLNCTEAR